MTRLIIHPENGSAQPELDTRAHDLITRELGAIGVVFEHWPAEAELKEGDDETAVLAAYRESLEKLERKGGYQSKDVVRLNPNHPDRVALRAKFLSEHIHDDDEVRIFVEGGATFFFGDQEAGPSEFGHLAPEVSGETDGVVVVTQFA